MPYLDLPDVSLFYTDSAPGSDRRPVVLVHGWTCDSHDWSWQIAALEPAQRVVALDLRGHGRSTTPDSGFTLADYAEDVRRLLTSLDGGPAVLVGHSMGALISSLIADETPELVAGLVVVDPPYGLSGETIEVARAFARRVAGSDGVEQVRVWLAGADNDGTPPWLATWHRRHILAMPHHALIETVADVHDSPTSIANEPLSSRLWSRRELPVLVVTADEATATREEPFFVHPVSKAVSFPGVGHWVHQERADEVNALLTTWLAEIG